MTPQEYSYCELLFAMIDRKILTEFYTSKMYHETCNYEMNIYVDWLLNRWLLLRNNIDHYPTTNNHQKSVVKKVRFNID